MHFAHLSFFYCDVVELGAYGKLKYYDSMTEEGKNFISLCYIFCIVMIIYILYYNKNIIIIMFCLIISSNIFPDRHYIFMYTLFCLFLCCWTLYWYRKCKCDDGKKYFYTKLNWCSCLKVFQSLCLPHFFRVFKWTPFFNKKDNLYLSTSAIR